MTMMPRIAARLLNTPLMVHQQKAAAIMAGLGMRITGHDVLVLDTAPMEHQAFANGRPSMGTLSDRVGRSGGAAPLFDMVGNVAVIPVEGVLVHKGAWVESASGETSYQGLQAQVSRALRDPAVGGVVFEVDSPGGEVSGAFETACMIGKLSEAKPTIAILTDHAYSAGYLMASACRSIVLPETGGCGSIGVITMHVDYSRALNERGMTVTVIADGAHKADGNPYEPLPEDVAAVIRADIRGMRETFCNTVAGFRAGRLSFEDAMATESACFTGEAAVERGLADATGQPQEVFQAFISMINGA